MIKAISANPIRKTAMAFLVTAPLMLGACKSGNNNNQIQQNQTEVISKAGSDSLKAVVLHDNSVKESNAAKIQRSRISGFSAEKRISDWNEQLNIIKEDFTDAKINKYNNIIDRFLKGENVSIEEKEFYDKYDSRLAITSGCIEGTVEGIISREDISKKAKNDEIRKINYDTYNKAFPVYRRILTGIALYYANENIPNDKKNEINSFLNKVTDGNYDIVINDIKKDEKSELNSPFKPY